MIVSTVLPLIGDAIGDTFFQPNHTPDKSPHAGAFAAMAKGEYGKAIEAFRAAWDTNPDDTYALSEMARVYCDKFGDHDSAAEVFESAIVAREWTSDQSAFLRLRLAEVRWEHQHNAEAAREVLIGIIGDYPGTNHAATATHQLHEIERQIAMEG
jgi:tetratricopeptide (TPR) repeat protein